MKTSDLLAAQVADFVAIASEILKATDERCPTELLEPMLRLRKTAWLAATPEERAEYPELSL